jgi:hypothetical protein
MINESDPETSKVGVVNTEEKTSHDRATELFNTSVHAKFSVIFDIKVKNPFFYEKIIHKNLDHIRCNKKRIF